MVDCIVNLPAKLFLNTQIPACLWFLRRRTGITGITGNVGNMDRGICRGKAMSLPSLPDTNDQILFIDARNEGYLINRRTRELSEEDIQKIALTYHNWRASTGSAIAKGKYEDIKGFCNSASIERVSELDYVLTPGRYVGLPDDEDDFDFNERFTSLKAEFETQLKEEEKLNALILENLKKVKLV